MANQVNVARPSASAAVTADRAAFFQRIAAAFQRANPVTDSSPAGHPVVAENLLRQVAAGDPGVIERWVQKATGNSIVVQRTKAGGLLSALDACLANHQITSLLLNADPYVEKHGLAGYLGGKGIETFRWTEPGCRERAFTAHAAITTCRYGVADAGSLVVWSEVGFGRSSTLTAAVHVVILRGSQVLADLVDVFARISAEAVDGATGVLPSNIVVINGPSKTSDIEMQLVTGVHGPKYLYVILLDDE